MRWLVLLLAFAPAVVGQSVVDPATMPRILPRFEAKWDDNPLACAVTPFGPALNFSFRLQAGFMVRVAMNQFVGPRHSWLILARVTPEGGDRKPVYLGMRIRLPDVPKNKNEVEVGGGYLLGEGSYQVNWMMLDDQGRVCRKEWRIDAHLKRGERAAKVAMRPYSVAAFSLASSPDAARVRDDHKPIRVTILMHTAPLFSRRTHFRATDRMMLIGSLAALLERLPTKSVRLVLFNLDQQKELYRQDEFRPSGLEQVEQAMNEMELNLVDYRTLQKPMGHVNLLADLVNRELESETPSDAVIFLGPSTRYQDKVPRDAMEKPAGGPRFFYFQYRPVFRRAVAVTPDSINFTISNLKGKNVVIRTPADFAKAIESLERVVQ